MKFVFILIKKKKVYHSEFIPLEWTICQHREQVKQMSYAKLIVDKSNVNISLIENK